MFYLSACVGGEHPALKFPSLGTMYKHYEVKYILISMTPQFCASAAATCSVVFLLILLVDSPLMGFSLNRVYKES